MARMFFTKLYTAHQIIWNAIAPCGPLFLLYYKMITSYSDMYHIMGVSVDTNFSEIEFIAHMHSVIGIP